MNRFLGSSHLILEEPDHSARTKYPCPNRRARSLAWQVLWPSRSAFLHSRWRCVAIGRTAHTKAIPPETR